MTRREMRLLIAAQLLGNDFGSVSEERCANALLVTEGMINIDRVMFGRDGDYLRPDRKHKKTPLALVSGYELAKLQQKDKR